MMVTITNEKLNIQTDIPLMKYTVDNGNGYAFSCLNIGATLTSLTMPDKDGNIHNVLLGFNEPQDFITDQTYFFGKAIGRVGGRIKDGAFQYNNEHIQLPQNEGNNTLHGGNNGFHSLWWDVSALENGIVFAKTIQSETDGFPAKLIASISYTWISGNRLQIEFTGENQSEIATLFNPTTHNYFNLNDDKTTGLGGHQLSIRARKTVELDENQIPTGKLLTISDTAYDFNKESNLLEKLESVKQTGASGFDDPYKVTDSEVAVLRNLDNGRCIRIHSDRNGLIFYSLNATDSKITVNDGHALSPHMAVALEPQTLPGAVHHPDFGNIVLDAGDKKTYRIVYELSVDE